MKTFRRDTETARVTTAQGIVQGYLQDGLLIFKGIPYAKAVRFHAPEAVKPWDGILDACSYGYVCPMMTNDPPRGELYVPHRFWPMDEDCLNLNLWTPGADGEKRPVLVWLHGGGFSMGSSIEQTAYDGAAMSSLGDAVVVSINHRLNILGYFDLSDFGEEYANSGNAGGDDIIAALQWIRENIAEFGGDPDNVTVFGQSGGGAKVTTLLQSPAADGLYAKGIVMSGVIGPVLADAEGSGRAIAEAVMKEMGLKSVKELETADYAAFARAYLKAMPALKQAGEYTGCCPHPNAYYAGDPLRVGFRAETKDVPLMVGSVFGEFTSFAPIPWDRGSGSSGKTDPALPGSLSGTLRGGPAPDGLCFPCAGDPLHCEAERAERLYLELPVQYGPAHRRRQYPLALLRYPLCVPQYRPGGISLGSRTGRAGGQGPGRGFPQRDGFCAGRES